MVFQANKASTSWVWG